MTVFTVVISAAYSLFESGRAVASRGEVASARDQAARAAFRALLSDLRAACGGPLDKGFKGAGGGSPDEPADTLEFLAFNHHPKAAPETDRSRVAYALDLDDSTPARGLVRRRTTLLTSIATFEDPNEGLEEVSADVVGLRFRYYDGSSWLENWDSAVSGTYPRAVEVAITVASTWREKAERETYRTRIFLPVAAATPPRQP